MKTKHTLGPWRVHEGWGLTVESSKCRIASIASAEYNAEANAHLIAAAPDMLEALERVLETKAHIGAIAHTMVKMAIAKAKGEA